MRLSGPVNVVAVHIIRSVMSARTLEFSNQLPQQLIRILRFFSVHFAFFLPLCSELRIEFVSLIKFPPERMDGAQKRFFAEMMETPSL